MPLLKEGCNAYRYLDVRAWHRIAVRSLVNEWTLRSVTYSLQDGCLASICTSYNKDSERYIWGLTAGCCGNGVLVCHVCWCCEARVADRFDPHKDPHLPFLAIPNRKSFGCTVTLTHCGTHATPMSSLRLSTKLNFPHPTYTVPRHLRSLVTLSPRCIRATTP